MSTEDVQPEKPKYRPQSEVTLRVVDNMRNLRHERGITAQRLEELVMSQTECTSLTRASIANLENNRRGEVSVTELLALATVFDVSFEWFVAAHGPKCNWCKDDPPEGYECLTCLAVHPRAEDGAA